MSDPLPCSTGQLIWQKPTGAHSLWAQYWSTVVTWASGQTDRTSSPAPQLDVGPPSLLAVYAVMVKIRLLVGYFHTTNLNVQFSFNSYNSYQGWSSRPFSQFISKNTHHQPPIFTTNKKTHLWGIYWCLKTPEQASSKCLCDTSPGRQKMHHFTGKSSTAGGTSYCYYIDHCCLCKITWAHGCNQRLRIELCPSNSV